MRISAFMNGGLQRTNFDVICAHFINIRQNLKDLILMAAQGMLKTVLRDWVVEHKNSCNVVLGTGSSFVQNFGPRNLMCLSIGMLNRYTDKKLTKLRVFKDIKSTKLFGQILRN
jgi:hypothetical protein